MIFCASLRTKSAGNALLVLDKVRALLTHVIPKRDTEVGHEPQMFVRILAKSLQQTLFFIESFDIRDACYCVLVFIVAVIQYCDILQLELLKFSWRQSFYADG